MSEQLNTKGIITNYHRWSGLNNRMVLPHHSGSCKSKIRVLSSLISSEASLLSLQVAILLCYYMVFPLCIRVCVCVQLLSFVRLFATPWTVAHQAPLSKGFSRKEYWSG